MARLVHVLLLQLLMPFTEPVLDVFVEVKREAVLTCDKVRDGQELCKMTTWLYSNPRRANAAVEFITLGKIRSNFRYKDRFSLTENCSLVIKNVQIEDGLHYSCKQYEKEGGRELSDDSTKLTVVSVEEHETGPNCYVSSPHRCSDIQVRWFYNDSEIRDVSSIKNHEFFCGATLVYKPSDYMQTQKDLFKCEITHNNKRYAYKLKSGKSPDGTDDRSDTEESSETLPGWWWWAVLVAVAAAALTITAVILVKRMKKKERPQENSDLPPVSLAPEIEPEDGVSYASVSYTRTKESKPKPRLNEEETVMYSSVKTPASHNLTAVDAAVRKH